ncbi:hypothetical protein [uncultured Sneathiella sp.]|mgnify:CR=1 FL=1|jgi:hypothetical protein|uniref:phage baseplate protein n=1 Tax=uncultured Sneathiella sp. TaxID=879315 RepID=UPI0030DDA51F|tara:strand:- start:23998 stop:24534 length:537 start_codon:yes stop_codon:yes gene_type:complete
MDWIKIGAGALIGGAVAAVITALLVIYFDKPAASPGGDGTGIESGAVVAFEGASSCPSGWSVYTKAESRVIVGAAGSSPGKGADGKSLSAHKAGTNGGQETVTLAADNLPPHTHQYNDIYFSSDGGTVTVPKNFGSGSKTDNNNKGYQITRTTNAEKTTPAAISNLPPFIALTYCVKS